MDQEASVLAEELEMDTEEEQDSVLPVPLSIQSYSKAQPLQVALLKKRTMPIWQRISDQMDFWAEALLESVITQAASLMPPLLELEVVVERED